MKKIALSILLLIVGIAIKAQSPQSLNVSFNKDAGNWTTESGSTYSIVDGMLRCEMALNSNNKYRGDLWYNYSSLAANNITFNSHRDKLIAIKFKGSRPSGSLKFEMQRDENSTLGWFNTQWNSAPSGSIITNEEDYIYYFDLSKDKSFATDDEKTWTLRRLHFIIADVVADTPPTYMIEWIATFASFEDLENYNPNNTNVSSERQFIHPGLSHKQSDIDRMRAMIDAKIDPWYTSFQYLSKQTNAQHTYQVKGNKSITTIISESETYSWVSADARAAYQNALMWVLTGDNRHADKAVEILNAWQNITHIQGIPLDAGRAGWMLIEAAELIKSTYSGWAKEDIQKFKDMLVYPGYSTTEVPTGNISFYWNVYNGDASRHGNQDIFAHRVVMAMGVFLDNEIMYERALRYFSGLTHREDDLPYPSGPPINSSTPDFENEYYRRYILQGRKNDVADYGYNGVINNFIWENGQCQESSRDQDHAILGLGLLSSIAEIAWNQGDDIYSLYDNRILKGYEWNLRYNVSYNYSYSDQKQPWEPTGFTTETDKATFDNGLFIQRSDRTGRWYSLNVSPHYESNTNISRGNFKSNKRPVYEIALAHYGVRMGMNDEQMKWTQRAHDISADEYEVEREGWSIDHLGWGGLIAHRSIWMAGDPVSFASGKQEMRIHKVPCTINAADYDYFVGNGQGRTYLNSCDDIHKNEYRQDGAIELIEGTNGEYRITQMMAGEWMNYTIHVPHTGFYDISAIYQASSNNGKISITIDNKYEFGSVSLVPSEGLSQIELYKHIYLNAGAQVMRVTVEGESNIIELQSIIIEPSKTEDGYINAIFKENTQGWKATNSDVTLDIENEKLKVNMVIENNGKYRGDICQIGGGTLHAGNYPILALKLQKPQVCNITLDTNLGSFGNRANAWSGIIKDDIYYYNLASTPLGSTLLATNNTTTLTTLQFKIADVSSDENYYTVDWIKTFKNLTELENYANDFHTSIYEKLESKIDYYIEGNQIFFRDVKQKYQINIYDINGKCLQSSFITNNSPSFSILAEGILLMSITQNNSLIYSDKLLIK